MARALPKLFVRCTCDSPRAPVEVAWGDGVLVRCPDCLLMTSEPIEPRFSFMAWAAMISERKRANLMREEWRL